MDKREEEFRLSNSVRDFILHWGEMGSRWGISRTVAQIHALLYVSEEPLNAEQIASALSLARSTVSTSLRELQTWGVVRLVHVMGDRRDHYEAMDDVWEMFRIVLDERKKRELDPTVDILREGVESARKDDSVTDHTLEKLRQMLDFFEAVSVFYDQTRKLPTAVLRRLARSSENVDELVHSQGVSEKG
jgi:DNA-binding transcriptional regulator GbsR (MarR family)